MGIVMPFALTSLYYNFSPDLLLVLLYHFFCSFGIGRRFNDLITKADKKRNLYIFYFNRCKIKIIKRKSGHIL